MRLVWSALAVAELTDLRRYSVDRWGREVAARYLGDLRDGAKRAAQAPERTRAVKGPFRLARVRSHVLVLHVDDAAGVMTVARVLHAATDIERHLP